MYHMSILGFCNCELLVKGGMHFISSIIDCIIFLYYVRPFCLVICVKLIDESLIANV